MGSSLLDFCSAFGMIFLIILNIVCLVLGIGVMAIGIYLQTNGGFLDSDVMALLDLVDLGGGFTLRDLIDLLVIVVIVVGVFTILVALSGGLGAILKNRVLLIIYGIILVLCIILELVILGFWIKLIDGINTFLRSQFEALLKNYAGVLVADVYSIGWNIIFILFGCCGISPITSTANDFETLPSSWWSDGSRGSDVIPQSCCQGALKENYVNYTNTDCTQSLQGYYTSGCYDVFNNLFTSLSAAAISITTLLVLLEGVAIAFSIVIIYKETRKKNEIV